MSNPHNTENNIWTYAEKLRDVDIIDEAICKLIDDPCGDNAVAVTVRIMEELAHRGGLSVSELLEQVVARSQST